MVIIDRTRCGLSCETGAVLFYPYLTNLTPLSAQWKKQGGNDYTLLWICEWSEKQKNIKNSLGAMWNASHLAEGLCALRHWKRVSMPQTTHSHRHPLTRAIHIAPRKKTTRRFTAKNQFLGTAYNYNKTLNTIYIWYKKTNFRTVLPCMMHWGIFLFILFDNQISEDWFFAEGERLLSFWRCHRPRKRAALVMWCG